MQYQIDIEKLTLIDYLDLLQIIEQQQPHAHVSNH